MNNRTLIKASVRENCIGFKTISWRKKSPRTFLITRDRLEKLEREQVVIANDIHSFAILRRNIPAGTLHIDFTWLGCDGDNNVTGHKETVTIRYDSLMTFVHDSAKEGGPSKWSTLSVIEGKRPRLIFYDVEGLRRCLENIKVRRKLLRFLRDNFKFFSADEIGFYPDFEPYSFFFCGRSNGVPGLRGGLILHGQENMEKAYYSTHT